MKSLIRNTAVNIAAFGVVSVGNLLLIPLIVRHYGLQEFGLIVVARLLLPTGFLAMFDFGLSEATTRYVASARAEDDWAQAGRVFGLALSIIIVVALILATAIGVGAETLTLHAFGLEAAKAEDFATLVRWTSLGLLVVFPGVICEATLKGMERFDLIRVGEVLAFLCYAGATLMAILFDLPYTIVALAFLGTTCLKYCGFMLLLSSPSMPIKPALVQMNRVEAMEVLRLAVAVLQGKIISTLLTHSAPLIILRIVGPAGVGAFDLLMRLPRFSKNVFGLINSAVLPTSATLEAKGDKIAMRRLVLTGTTLAVLLFLPPLLGGAVYSGKILNQWLGSEYVAMAPWLSVPFVWVALISFYGVGATMLLARRRVLRRLNQVAIVHLALFFVVGLAGLNSLGERAFILAILVSTALVLPLNIYLICRAYDVEFIAYAKMIFKFSVSSLAAVAWFIGFDNFIWPDTLAGLLFEFGTWCVIYWLTAYLFALSKDERRSLHKAFAVLRQT